MINPKTAHTPDLDRSLPEDELTMADLVRSHGIDRLRTRWRQWLEAW